VTIATLLRGDRRSRVNFDEPQPGEEALQPPPGRDEDWLTVWSRVCEDLAVLGVGPYRADPHWWALVDSIRIYARRGRAQGSGGHPGTGREAHHAIAGA
jgi:hypothetical protein